MLAAGATVCQSAMRAEIGGRAATRRHVLLRKVTGI
jgi:hypothetical protein